MVRGFLGYSWIDLLTVAKCQAWINQTPTGCLIGGYNLSIRWNDYWGSTPRTNKLWFIDPGLTLLSLSDLYIFYYNICVCSWNNHWSFSNISSYLVIIIKHMTLLGWSPPTDPCIWWPYCHSIWHSSEIPSDIYSAILSDILTFYLTYFLHLAFGCVWKYCTPKPNG